MELKLVIAIIIVTMVVMLGLVWIFKGWLKERSKYIDNDQHS